jgi:hypothetical protein
MMNKPKSSDSYKQKPNKSNSTSKSCSPTKNRTKIEEGYLFEKYLQIIISKFFIEDALTDNQQKKSNIITSYEFNNLKFEKYVNFTCFNDSKALLTIHEIISKNLFETLFNSVKKREDAINQYKEKEILYQGLLPQENESTQSFTNDDTYNNNEICDQQKGNNFRESDIDIMLFNVSKDNFMPFFNKHSIYIKKNPNINVNLNFNFSLLKIFLKNSILYLK